MADEAEADDVALDTASAETQQDEINVDEIDPEIADEIAGAGQEDEDDGELDELEFGFKKYQVPKSLKSAVESMRGDYTKKTQDVSARAKALDTRESQIEERFKATDEELEQRSELRGVGKLLEEYAKLTPEDWAAHRRANPIETEDHWTQFQLLKDRKAALEGKVGEFEKARTDAAQQELAKRVTATTEFGQKNIPGFSQKQIDTLIAYASEQGIDEATIKKNWSPTFYKLLHRAHLGEQLLKKTAARKTARSESETQPLKTVSGGTSPAGRKSVRDMSVSDHAEAIRKEKVRQRA